MHPGDFFEEFTFLIIAQEIFSRVFRKAMIDFILAGPYIIKRAKQERCPRGRRSTLGKRVYLNRVPRVRIPLSPK